MSPSTSVGSGSATERTPLLINGSNASNGAIQDGTSTGVVDGTETADNSNGTGGGKDEVTHDGTPLHVMLPIMIAIFSTIFLAALDGVLVTTLLAPISSSFGESQKGAWLGTSYLISTTAFCTTFGKLADVVGRRVAMLIALFFFGVGTMGCAIAPTMNSLIAARGVAGVGGAGVQTLGSIIVGDLVPLRQRAMWQGFANVVFCIGTSGGAPLGGFISGTLGWRYGFGLQVPLLCLSALLVSIFVKLPIPVEAQSQSLRTKLERFDFQGIAALVTAVISSQIALSFWTADELPISNVRVWGLLLLATVSFLSFIYIEEYIAAVPVVPFRLLHNRNFALSITFFFLNSFSLFLLTFHIPLFFETVLLLSPAQAGLRSSPWAFSVCIGSITAGFYVRRSGKFKGALNLGNVMAIVSAIVFCTWDRLTTADWIYFLSPIPLGVGTGVAGTMALIALLSTLQKEDLARANGFMYLSRHLGGVMGVGLGGALAQASLRIQLDQRITGKGKEEIIDFIRHNAAELIHLPLHTRELAVESYQQAIRTVFVVAGVGFVIINLVCWPITEVPLHLGGVPTRPNGATTNDEDEDEA